MNKKLIALFLGTSLVLAACGGGDKSSENGADDGKSYVDDSAGAKIYKQNCINCHGDNLQGVSGPNLQEVGAKQSKDDIEKIILEGKGGGMPKGLVKGKDAETVAQWLSEKK
ncbi:cytochrome c551 [Bacillus testis]|uniref:cytochrome c551 n=1 Tax=Bacillus testis TaxID=1622072 RepID=UPI00067F63AA|nr:cytochrome c [Bacillus testis]